MSLVLDSISQSDRLNTCCVLLDNGIEYTGKCNHVATLTTLCNPNDKYPLVSYNIGHIYCEEHKHKAYGPLFDIPVDCKNPAYYRYIASHNKTAFYYPSFSSL